jgi:hypothetical protein
LISMWSRIPDGAVRVPEERQRCQMSEFRIQRAHSAF